MAKKKSSFWADFKAFISKGNVIDMAVGVVIGGAFSAIVNGLVNYIINPCVGKILALIGLDVTTMESIKTQLTPAVLDEAGEVVTPEVAIMWGSWIQTILNFIIVALCIFVALRVLMHAKNSLNEKEIEEAAKKAAEEKAAADAKAAEDKKAADEAAVALAKKQAELEAATLHQEKLLEEIRDLLKNK